MPGSTTIINWLGYGTFAARPNATTLSTVTLSGTTDATAFYFAKDTDELYLLDRDTPTWVLIGTGGGGVTALEELTDVGIDSSLATNDFLNFNGTSWINISPTAAAALIVGSINGLVRANGSGVLSAAVAGTHYAAAPTGSANTPLFNNGAGGFTNGTRSGNTTEVATWSGSKTTGNAIVLDASGNLIDGGTTPGGVTTLDGLSDVVIDTSLALGDGFKFAGSYWESFERKGKGHAHWASGSVVTDGLVVLCEETPFPGILNYARYYTGNGSFSTAIAINGVNVTNLSSLTVNSPTATNTNATGANTFPAGARVTATQSGTTGSPTDALIMVDFTWR